MPTFPGELAYRAERSALAATVLAMDRPAFEAGPTLCAGWTPRDIVAHLLGIDDGLADYLHPDLLRRGVGAGNARQTRRYAALSTDELLERVRRWAQQVPLQVRAAAGFLLGDVAIHHQDLLRPAGLPYELPRASAAAIYREGVVLSGTRLLRHRLHPSDGIGRPIGVGRRVTGPTAALGLWLSGRGGLEGELTVE